MFMAYQAYKVQGVTNAVAALSIVVGFVGQLKFWWDNILTTEAREAILSHKYTQRNSSGMDVEEEDVVESLLHTITLHFIGNPKEEKAMEKTILINLRCPNFTDYRWYKDGFLTKFLKWKMAHKISGKKDLLQDYQNSSENVCSVNFARILVPMTSLLVSLQLVNCLA